MRSLSLKLIMVAHDDSKVDPVQNLNHTMWSPQFTSLHFPEPSIFLFLRAFDPLWLSYYSTYKFSLNLFLPNLHFLPLLFPLNWLLIIISCYHSDAFCLKGTNDISQTFVCVSELLLLHDILYSVLHIFWKLAPFMACRSPHYSGFSHSECSIFISFRGLPSFSEPLTIGIVFQNSILGFLLFLLLHSL